MNRTARMILLCCLSIGGCLLLAPGDARAEGSMLLRDVCRLKGQEIHTLQGLGLVVGLRGTGDAETQPTLKALSRMMQLMGGQMSVDSVGLLNTAEMKASRNTALVFVTARVPAVGAQQGDRLDCSINAISAKSLEGGYLMLAPLLGPRADQPIVYAIAEGPLQVDASGVATTGRVQLGAKMQTSIVSPFENNGVVTLVLDKDFADFDVAQTIQDAIDTMPENMTLLGTSPGNARPKLARAIDQLHVELTIPPVYRDQPVMFLSNVLRLPIDLPHNRTRVVINERDGVVVIGEDVRIAPSLITHQNLRIEAVARQSFIDVDPESEVDGNPNPKLKALADALNALDVPTEDLIAIIKALKRKGDLYGDVIFQ